MGVHPWKCDWYLLLQEYYEKHGDINVPTAYKVEYQGRVIYLGRYIAHKRQAYRALQDPTYNTASKITEEEIHLFESMGICWNPGRGKRVRGGSLHHKADPFVSFRLFQQVLLALQLEPTSLFQVMEQENISMEEAIQKVIFQQEVGIDAHLEAFYYAGISQYRSIKKEGLSSDMAIEQVVESLVSSCLDSSEKRKLVSSFERCITVINQYHIFDVGFTRSNQEKMRKIQEYMLDSDEVEESFFVNISFHYNRLLDQNSPLYKRRVSLKNLTVFWNSYTEEEQIRNISRYQLTEGEVIWIVSMREKIDAFQGKVESCHQDSSKVYVKNS